MPTAKKKKALTAKNPPVAAEQKSDSLWSMRGMEDVNLQRAAQLNLWTVLGGLQVAALFTQVGSVWEQLQAGRWYVFVYALNSLLIIALVWSASFWDSVVLKWTVTVPTILTQLFGNFFLGITCLLIVDPAGWFLALAISATCNGFHNILLSRSGAWEIVSPKMLETRRANLWVENLWPLLAYAGAVHMYLVPSVLVQSIWGVIALAIIIEGLFRQHHDMKRDRKELGIP
jgi:hypothetical protein